MHFLLEEGKIPAPDDLLPKDELEPDVPAELAFHVIAQWFCNCIAINGLVGLAADGTDGERAGARHLIHLLRRLCPEIIDKCLQDIAAGTIPHLSALARSLIEDVQEEAFYEELSCCLAELIRNKLMREFRMPQPAQVCCARTINSIRNGTGRSALGVVEQAQIVGGIENGDEDMAIRTITDALDSR
ncbi:MAG: hypothetical protein HUU15_15865 [Candidatus Brocadiae bacterium]|nr:hypothetical protein [Candidatus Brocadiia bacterium]